MYIYIHTYTHTTYTYNHIFIYILYHSRWLPGQKKLPKSPIEKVWSARNGVSGLQIRWI